MNSPEPVAIVGVACRFAGGIDSPETFWSLLREGGDTVGEVPAERWEWYAAQGPEHAAAVREVSKRGAFLDDVAGFDADFFDITPREAALMDPQQRIVLELAWEALEHAGIAPTALAGSDAGVFVGIGSDDYGRRLLEDLPRIEAWTGIGAAYCAVANRVSYALDLRGPSVAVDTACSSSLVSIHMAVQALRAGECPVALAGGVLVMAAPGLSMVLDAAGATAPDGRSKSFSADADGYGRGEGGALVVLKTLADARRDGDRVLAVVRGSAVHQDGRTNGIMAPNGEAQAHLLRRTYAAAGVDPSTVDYIEAHGTGTRVGDPLEAGALAEVLGAGRPADKPCLLGSVKPNIGHLEAGAGAAGVVKAVLALWHGEIPAHLNFTAPNPSIPWDTCGLKVVTERTPWPRGDTPRRAAVSGYGYGGTLAHVVLEEGDAPGPVGGGERPRRGSAVVPLSGASRAAVRAQAARLAERIAAGGLSLADVGHTLALRRAHLAHRAAVTAADTGELVARLREIAAGSDDAGDAGPPITAARADGGVAWVFSGHGSQWVGMARELMATEPVFAAVIAEIEPVFTAELGVSPVTAIAADGGWPVDVIQPLIFAVQVGLTALWRSWGLSPSAVIGHSVGEIAAAVAAGVLALGDGARLVCRRSVLLRRVAGRGAMAVVDLPPAEVADALAGRTDVAVAVSASPVSTVVSGDIAAVAELSAGWRAAGRVVRQVDSDVAFHSPQMDPLLAELAAAAADLPVSAPTVPLYTTTLADPRSTAPRDGAYWAANLGGRVRFAEAVTAALVDGHRAFLEISAHPVVQHSVEEVAEHSEITGSDGVDVLTAHSLRRGRPEREALLTTLGQLHCHGVEVDWAATWSGGALVDLPTVAWQHRPHWAEEPPARAGVEPHDPHAHTLLGGRITARGSTATHLWRTTLDLDSRPYPGRHPVREVEIVPAAVLLNTFREAAGLVGDAGASVDLVEVNLRVPVSLTSARDLQVVVQGRSVQLSSRHAQHGDDLGWVTHTTALVEPPAELGAADPAGTDEDLPPGYVIDRLATLGVAAMGFDWTVTALRRGPGCLVADVRHDGPDAGRTWAPVLDAALSAASVVFPGEPILRMPARIRRVTLAAAPPSVARVSARMSDDTTVEVEITDESGAVIGRFDGLRYGVLEGAVGTAVAPHRLVHTLRWRPVETTGALPVSAVVVGPDSALRRRAVAALERAGVAHRVVAGPDLLRGADTAGPTTVLVVPEPGEPTETAVSAPWLLAGAVARVAGAGHGAPARVWCLTQGVADARDPGALGPAAAWGLGRVVGGEHPDLWGGVVDVGVGAEDLTAALAVLGAPRGPADLAEDVTVVRDGTASVGRLAPVDGDPVRAQPECVPEATYLVTGGLGALGLVVAHRLAARGARRLVLTGRTALPPRSRWDHPADAAEAARVDGVRSLERLGVTVVAVAADVADPDHADRLSAEALGLPPIRGVVHAAGVLDNRTLRTLDEDSLRRVLRPKVDGALLLHRLFPPGSVDFFTLFSSCGQLLGLEGQASYAAANAFLDALAAHRAALGDAGASSLAWTSWRGLGMSTSSAVIDAELAAKGTGDIGVDDALRAWDLVERHGLGYAAVLRVLPREPGERRPPVLAELADPATGSADGADGSAPAGAPWTGLTGAELRAALVEEIRAQVATESRLPAAEVDPRRPLVEMGLDSVMTVRIRRALERRFGLPLPATLFWDRPTAEAIAALLAERLDAAGEAEVRAA